MEQGYIKLYRKIKLKGWYKNSKYVHLWVHILLKANHKQSEFMWNDKIIIIKEGQFITGRKQLSEETGLAQSTIEKILKIFEKEHQIEQQKTNKFRLITVINWKEYQGNGHQKEQQTDNRRTTDGQQMDTNKNDNNEKNEKNENILQRESVAEEFNFNDYLENMLTKPKHIQIIRLYWLSKKRIFVSRDQVNIAIKRELRAARDLTSYSLKRIQEVLDWLADNANFKFTLETVGKYIDENLQELNSNKILKI